MAYLRMHHFVVKFLKIFFASGGKGALTPLTKILRPFLVRNGAARALNFG